MSIPATPTLFPRIFSPLKLGARTLKNRIFSSGHDTVMAHQGLVTDQLIAYHEARAAGGAGLIVMQVVGVHESAKYTSQILMGTDDAAVPGFKRLADTVRPYGTLLFAQLFHPGREILESQDGSAPVAYAPSAVPNERFRVMPRALSAALIQEIIDGYVATAKRLQSAGLDGVEIVASHGYLPSQFLNPRVNLRTDEYGGNDENRLRFLQEVILKVRQAVGPDFVVGMRISGDEKSEEGLSPEDAIQACITLENRTQLDYISVCAGTSATLSGSDHIAPSMAAPAAYTAPLSARVKQAVKVPVLVAGRINQPHEAEKIIAEGQADACAMTRALICDPEMPNKARAGKPDDIRACIGCNQACIGHFQKGYPISCIQHPETGRELIYGTRRRAPQARKVLVAGGGPAGLKAAVVAAERGHQVTLFEASRWIGGQVRLAERLPGRAEFGGAITNLEQEAKRAGVIIRTHEPVMIDTILREAPDAVIIATGARPRPAAFDTEGAMPVLTAWQILEGAQLPAGRVVIADWRSDWIGLGVAIQLAQAGNPVTLAVNSYQAGDALQQYVRDAMLTQAFQAQVNIVPLTRLYGVDDDTVYLQNVLTDEAVILDEVGSLVLAQGHEPLDDLSALLHDYAGDVHAIGDCVTPRTVEEAVLEGLKVASAL